MYRAKYSGGGHRFYDESMQAEAAWRLHVQAALPRLYGGAAGAGSLELVFQPQVRLVSGRITALEALVRWRHPERGLLLPDQFLPIAEDTGQAAGLGAWVLREAIGQFGRAARRSSALRQARLCVNVSPTQLGGDDTLLRTVREALAASGLAPQQLTLEMTEAALVGEPPRVARQLRALRREGVSVALDDLGSGFSSLALLHELPFDYVKIDRALVTGLPASGRGAALVHGLARLAHALGARVCAEGIETPEQLQAVCAAGCDDAQGYLLGRPAPLATTAAGLRFDRITLPLPRALPLPGVAALAVTGSPGP